ncbi:MAG: protein kinase [Planctomycetota bacterium]
MIYACHDCLGQISLEEVSTATVYVCPHCGAHGNVMRLRENAPVSAGADGIDPDAAANDALEPITGAAANPDPAGGQARTMDYYPATPAQAPSNPFLKEFTANNIFDQMEAGTATPGPAAPAPMRSGQPPPARPPFVAVPPRPAATPPPVRPAPAQPPTPAAPVIAGQMVTVDCPVCREPNQVPADSLAAMYNCASCGSLFSPSRGVIEGVPPSDDLVGRQIGGCMVQGRIGEGGMGTVYQGMQVSLDRQVAIKILPRQYTRNGSFIQRFEREAKALAKISHQNIMQIYDFGLHGDVYYMIMEFIDGQSLSDVLEERFVLPLEEALPFIKQAALGLACAQKNGVIHRDVKPDNIMVDDHNVVKMTDFGLAKMVGMGVAELTQEGVRVGTPAFMSPEQCKGQKSLDVRTDIYSLGVTFYFALSGKLPFTGDSPFAIMLKHQNQQATPLKNLVPGLPEAISEIVDHMMEKDPDDRYQSWPDFLDALAAVERFMSANLPDASDTAFRSPHVDTKTRNIEVQQQADVLPPDWGANEGPPPSPDDEKIAEIARLVQEGDGLFSAGNFDEAINTWQKALFLDPNNVEIQDKISEARGRLRQKKIESMLAEANEFERKGWYREALAKLEEMAKLKLTWQVKDMVSRSITRVKDRMRKRQFAVRVVRLLIVAAVLFGALVIVYPLYMERRARQAFERADATARDAAVLMARDFDLYKVMTEEAIAAFRKVSANAVPNRGIAGLVFRVAHRENPWLEKATQRADELELRIRDEAIRYTYRRALEEADRYEKVGKVTDAELVLDKAVAIYGKETPHYEMLAVIHARVKAAAAGIRELYEAAVANDAFEKTTPEEIQLFAAYAKVQTACAFYRRVSTEYADSVYGLKAKRIFQVNSTPEGAEVTVIMADGREITIRDQLTPLEIPLAMPNQLFTLRVNRPGFKPVEKKYRENTLDRLNELFILEAGPLWVGRTSERKSINSQLAFAGGLAIVLANGRLQALRNDNGLPAWDEENYGGKDSPIISPAFNNDRDILVLGNDLVVPGNDGRIFKIIADVRAPAKWLSAQALTGTGREPTAPVALKVGPLRDRTVLFYGGGPVNGAFVGALYLDDLTDPWSVAGRNGPACPVDADVRATPVFYRGNIVAHTDRGTLYYIDAATGAVIRMVPAAATGHVEAAAITAQDEWVYYLSTERGQEKSQVQKINLVTGEVAWRPIMLPGLIEPAEPVLVGNRLILAIRMFDKGEVIALDTATGTTVWSYPKDRNISPITPGITAWGRYLFCPAGTTILVLDADGNLVHDKYGTQFGKITRKVQVHDNAIYCVSGYGMVYKYLIPPELVVP